MQFADVPLDKARGAILAHALSIGGRRFGKGCIVDAKMQKALGELGVASITVAVLADTDVAENAAAQRIGDMLGTENLTVTRAFSGRVNLIAQVAGVVGINAEAVLAINLVDEAITLATLPDKARVNVGALVGTVKIIPYGVGSGALNDVMARIPENTIRVAGFTANKADLVLTKTDRFKPSLLAKGQQAVVRRLQGIGWALGSVQTVDHTAHAVAQAIKATQNDLVLILGASATSDKRDVVPAGLVQAGGRIIRFGMPVDPGNLLMLGEISGRNVIGLPGCARAPALNGADWVLERLGAGLSVSNRDIAVMGVGGLLKEIPQRVQPRLTAARAHSDKVEVILLAAGRSSRMKGAHKLFLEIDGEPLLRRSVRELQKSRADGVKVVVPPESARHEAALAGLDAQIVHAPDSALGLSASIRAGTAALSPDCGAVIVALADMPDVTARHLDRLIAAYDPTEERFICTPLAPNGKRGNPVLFDRRYFEDLSGLSGDHGAKQIIDGASEYVVSVPMDAGVLVDLDTPEAWDGWLARHKGG